MSNPFETEDDVKTIDVERKEIETKIEDSSEFKLKKRKEFTTEELFDALISQLRSDVSKRLIKGAKEGYEKLLGDLDEGEFIEKHFTKIIELRINGAKLNNK